MKRLLAILLTLSFVLGLTGVSVSAANAKGTVKPLDLYDSEYFYSDADGMPESPHSYPHNMDKSWYIIREGATSISVTFSEDTKTEDSFDELYIFDGNGNQMGCFYNTALAGQTITVEGDTVQIRLTSDHTVNYYGFRVTNISYTKEEDSSTEETSYSKDCPAEFLPESHHNYANSTNDTWTLSCNGADYITLTFSADSCTEAGWDKVNIYDGNGADVGTYSGSSLSDLTVTVYDDTVIIVLTTDGSITYYGFRFESITAHFGNYYTFSDSYWALQSPYDDFTEESTDNSSESSEPEQFTVSFVGWDGTELKAESVSFGSGATAPEAPARLGYSFIGWSEPFDYITEDTVTVALYERTYLIGDANLDGRVNSLDAATILKYDAALITLSDLALLSADVNWNGQVNSLDAAMILRYDANLLAQLPQCPIYNLSAGGNYFIGNQNLNITFTVNAGIYYESIELYDESNTLLGIMKDDGLGADTRAGDGIYTLNTTVYYNVSGTSANVIFYCKSGDDQSEDLTLTFLSNEYGSLSGVVKNASDRSTSIEYAAVKVYRGDALYTTAYTNADGQYSFTLPDGNYKIIVSANGFVALTTYATIENGYDTYLETFLMAENTGARTGVACGVIKNSLTGIGEADVELNFVKDWNNFTSTNYMDVDIVTDGDGAYTVELPLGNYSVILTKENFVTAYFNIVVFDGVADNQDGVITPVIDEITAGGSYLITLTWGYTPTDLDSHVRGTLSSGSDFHVYFSDKSQMDGGTEVCNLDYDDVTSYGPEHVTLVPTTDGAYYYYVYQYSSAGTLAASEARVTVECDNRVIASFNVPTDQGNGRYWNIFAIKDGRLIIQNTITDGYDTSYAG